MKLQTATRLALYAVLELAAQPDQQFSRMEIAKKFNVSSNHLSKVMRDLGKAGLVDATRGVGGGYWFIGNAKRTTLMDIIKIFEPFPFDSTDRSEAGQETEVGQALDIVLDEISETIHSTLDTISIKTMLTIKDRNRN
jgi:Rrf2 family transcriptional regulator, nitric oxide-sensitive transcriptional repressor